MYFTADTFSCLTSFKIAQCTILKVHMITFVFNLNNVSTDHDKCHGLKLYTLKIH